MIKPRKLIARTSYLDSLKKQRDKQVIKVITGIRRCGKSTLLQMYQDYLLSSDVTTAQITAVNLEFVEFAALNHYAALYEYVNKRLLSDKMNYVFIDEVQMCTDFQRAVDGLFVKNNVDIYITGSNAYMLSGELATLLSGRFITIEMLPLSFGEYVLGIPDTDMQKAFRDYMRFGGFPLTLQYNRDEELIHQYIDGVYNTILKKDIVQRYKIQDVTILEDVIRFLFDNIGNITTAKKISDTLTSGGRKISQPTVENYLKALCDSFIIYQINRYDIKGKQYLKTLSKYYLADLGLRNYLLGYKNVDTGHILENIVYFELRRRRYKVYLGKAGNSEIDFVALKQNETLYVQVTDNVRDPLTLERVLAPLRSAKDFHPRLLITNDHDFNASYDGIKSINIVDFLLEQ